MNIFRNLLLKEGGANGNKIECNKYIIILIYYDLLYISQKKKILFLLGHCNIFEQKNLLY